MDISSKEKLDSLRASIPIGIKGAIKLLRETDNDVEKACTILKKKAEEIIKQKISFDANDNDIREHLSNQNYDIEKTLNSLFVDRYSLTERILLTNKDKERTLSILMQTIENDDNLKRNFWLDLEAVKRINTHRRCLVIIMEWINYEEWEGFDYAIACENWTQAMIIQLKDELKLNEIADKINEALTISNTFYQKQRKVTEYAPINEQASFFEQHKPLIYEKLIDYVEMYIKDFPNE